MSTRNAYSPWQNEAAVLACTLRAGGFPAEVADWHFISIKPSLEFGYNRPRMLVPPSCRREAEAWLESLEPASTEPIFPCPSCGGETRRVRRLLLMAILTSLGTFHPFFSRHRRCGSCKKTFKAEPPEPFTVEELGYAPHSPSVSAAGSQAFARSGRRSTMTGRPADRWTDPGATG